MNKSFYRWFSLFLMLCFSGCFTGLSDSVSAKSDKLITVSGSVRSIGAVPSSLASLHDAPRTAFPSVPGDVDYKVVAVKKDNSSETYTVNADSETKSFSINLKAGTWNFYVQGKAGDNLIFEGTKEIELTEKDSTIDGFEITVKPKVTGNGTGTVSLKIARDGTEVTNKINKIVAKWNEDGEQKSQTFDSWTENTVTFTMNGGTISSGSYTVGFTFYDENDAVLFFCAEVVNIFDNMKTDSWVSASTHDDGSYITSDGKFKITGALVQRFVATTLYVNGEGGTIGTDGDDSTGTGGYFAPFKTVSKAATVINASPKPNASFTIYVSGKTEEDLQIAINRNITIQGLPATATIQRKDTNGKTMISVAGSGNLTMQDITLDGNKKELSSNLYMGIYISGTANLNNCRIINCHSPNSNGGAIYVAPSGAVTMTDVNIENCKAKFGGAIYVYNGTLTMNGGSIQNCTASGGGGGVFIFQNGKMFMYGSAVIGDSSKNTVATGENACSNYATESGGGIYNQGKLYLGYSEANDDGSPNTDTASTLDGGIYYNYSTTDGGGGIRNNGTLYMNSGTIAYNGAGRNGGGVYIGNDSTFSMSGGEISGNSAGNKGSGIYHNGASLNMSGSATVDSSNVIYLPSGKTINVAGDLDAGIRATIEPQTYTLETQVLTSGTGVTLADQVGKFAVSTDPHNVSASWAIGTNGKLGLLAFETTDTSWEALQTNIDQLLPGGTLTLGANVTAGSGDSEIEIRKDITIQGSQQGITIDGNNICRIFHATDTDKTLTLTLRNLTLKNGCAVLGGALYFSGKKLKIENCVFEGNSTDDGGSSEGKGGALHIVSATDDVYIKNTKFIDNEAANDDNAGKGGAIYVKNANITLEDCEFSENSSWGLNSSYSDNIYKAKPDAEANDKNIITLKTSYTAPIGDMYNPDSDCGKYIFLEKDQKIKLVDSNLVVSDSHNNKIYIGISTDGTNPVSVGEQLITGDSDYVSSQCSKFYVNYGEPYKIDSEGKIQQN